MFTSRRTHPHSCPLAPCAMEGDEFFCFKLFWIYPKDITIIIRILLELTDSREIGYREKSVWRKFKFVCKQKAYVGPSYFSQKYVTHMPCEMSLFADYFQVLTSQHVRPVSKWTSSHQVLRLSPRYKINVTYCLFCTLYRYSHKRRAARVQKWWYRLLNIVNPRVSPSFPLRYES